MTLLRLGSEGDEVSELQRRLQALGYDIQLSGHYDADTRRAVMELQRQAGIDVDGICGRDTRGALDIAEAAHRAGYARDGSFGHEEDGLARAGALHADSIPQGGPDTQGRYRLVTMNGEATGPDSRARVESEMVLIDPDGRVVWRGDAVTGGWGSRGGALPGMNPETYRRDMSDRPIIAEYEINYSGSDRRSARRNPTFAYANGEGGFFMHLLNPTNMRELGGAGRDEFGIHPGGELLSDRGREVNSAGCMKLESDNGARDFWDIMMSLPPDQRPASLEIVNRDHVGREIQMDARSRYQFAEASPAPESGHRPTSSLPDMLANILGQLFRG